MKKNSVSRILLIDDQEGFGQLIEQVLVGTETEFIACTDPRAGLREAMVFRPDLILLDVDMPELTGPEILDQLKRMSATKDVPVMMFTARTDPETVNRVLTSGAVDYLIKPFEVSSLAEKLNRLLDRTIFDAEALVKLKERQDEVLFQVDNTSDSGLLLIDDDPVIGRVIQDLAKEMGLTYAWASEPSKAWLQIETTYPRLIILDIDMPGEDGLKMLTDLRSKKETCCIPVLMLTGSSNLEHVKQARDLGAQGYMLKPFSVPKLIEKIQSLLKSKI